MSDKVQGRCPMGCGETLFLGEHGYITCSWESCPNPSAASTLLIEHTNDWHDVSLGDEGSFLIAHPIRERIEGSLATCPLHADIKFFIEQGMPIAAGVYRVRATSRVGNTTGWQWTQMPDDKPDDKLDDWDERDVLEDIDVLDPGHGGPDELGKPDVVLACHSMFHQMPLMHQCDRPAHKDGPHYWHGRFQRDDLIWGDAANADPNNKMAKRIIYSRESTNAPTPARWESSYHPLQDPRP